MARTSTTQTNLNSTDSDPIGFIKRIATAAGLNWSDSVLIPNAVKIRFRDDEIFIHSDADGFLSIEADTQVKVGVAGDVVLGDSTTRQLKPDTDLKINLGNSSKRFNDAYIGGIGYKSLGSSSSFAHFGGTIAKSIATVATSGTSETTLYTYTLPANALINDGDSIELHCWGTTTVSTSDKQLRTYFGSALTLFDVPDGIAWHVTYKIYRESATTQRGFADFFCESLPQCFLETATETLSGSVIVKVTGIAPSSGTISGRGFHITYHPA